MMITIYWGHLWAETNSLMRITAPCTSPPDEITLAWFVYPEKNGRLLFVKPCCPEKQKVFCANYLKTCFRKRCQMARKYCAHVWFAHSLLRNYTAFADDSLLIVLRIKHPNLTRFQMSWKLSPKILNHETSEEYLRWKMSWKLKTVTAWHMIIVMLMMMMS